VNPRRRNLLKLRARQAKVAAAAAPVEPAKRKAVSEVATEEVVEPVAEEPKVKPTKTKRKSIKEKKDTWKL
jgi:hypothetical protein